MSPFVSCKPAVDHTGNLRLLPLELLIMGKKDGKLDEMSRKDQKVASKTKEKSAKEVVKTAKKKEKKSARLRSLVRMRRAKRRRWPTRRTLDKESKRKERLRPSLKS